MTTNVDSESAVDCAICPVKRVGAPGGPCRTDPIDPLRQECSALDLPAPGTSTTFQGTPNGPGATRIQGPGLGGPGMGMGDPFGGGDSQTPVGDGWRRVRVNGPGQDNGRVIERPKVQIPVPPSATMPTDMGGASMTPNRPQGSKQPSMVIPKLPRQPVGATPDKGGGTVGTTPTPTTGKTPTGTGKTPGITVMGGVIPTIGKGVRPDCPPEMVGTELCDRGSDSLAPDCFDWGMRTYGGHIGTALALADEFCGAQFRAARDARVAAQGADLSNAAAKPTIVTSTSLASAASTFANNAPPSSTPVATKPAGDPSIGPDLVAQCMEAYAALPLSQRIVVMKTSPIAEHAYPRLLVGDALRGVDDPRAFMVWLNDSFDFGDPEVAAFCNAVMQQSRGYAPAGDVKQPSGLGGLLMEVIVNNMPPGGRVFWDNAEVSGTGRGWLDATHWGVLVPQSGVGTLMVMEPSGARRYATLSTQELASNVAARTVQFYDMSAVPPTPLAVQANTPPGTAPMERFNLLIDGMPHGGHVFFDPYGSRVPDAEGIVEYTESGAGWLPAGRFHEVQIDGDYLSWLTTLPKLQPWGMLYVTDANGQTRRKQIDTQGRGMRLHWNDLTATPKFWTHPSYKPEPYASILARLSHPERSAEIPALLRQVNTMTVSPEALGLPSTVRPSGDPGSGTEVVIDGMPHDGRVFWNWREITTSGRGWLDGSAMRRWAVTASAYPGHPLQLVVQDAAGRSRATTLDLRGPITVRWDKLQPIASFSPQTTERRTPNYLSSAQLTTAFFRPAGDIGGFDTLALFNALPLDEQVRVMQGPAFVDSPYAAALAHTLLTGNFELDGVPVVDLLIAHARNSIAAGSLQQAVLDADVVARAIRLGLVSAPAGDPATNRCDGFAPAGFPTETWAQLQAMNPAAAQAARSITHSPGMPREVAQRQVDADHGIAVQRYRAAGDPAMVSGWGVPLGAPGMPRRVQPQEYRSAGDPPATPGWGQAVIDFNNTQAGRDLAAQENAQAQAAANAAAAQAAQQTNRPPDYAGIITAAVQGAGTAFNAVNTVVQAGEDRRLRELQLQLQGQANAAQLALQARQLELQAEIARITAERNTTTTAAVDPGLTALLTRLQEQVSSNAAQLAAAAAPPAPVVEPSGWDAIPTVGKAAIIGVPTLAVLGLGAAAVFGGRRNAKGNGRSAANRKAKRNCGDAANAHG